VSFAEGLLGVTLDGKYRLDAVLGEGGMGSVFRATHLALERKVAIKLLKPHLTSDDTALQRFAAEARRTMRVDSPHAVKVLDFGVTEHRDYYMVLEYLDGRTVQRELEVDGPFAAARVIHVARHALSALAAAHDSGLVHRDIKPDNLLLMRVGDDPDYTKVLDFGVAKLMEGAARSTRSQLQLTQQGMVFGTPEFMSREQACGLPIDGRSDLYALAATMFAMLTGCGLYAAARPIEWLTHHARTPPPHLGDANPALADQADLDALLQRCLAKRAEDRPQSARELDGLLADLERGGGAAGVAAQPPSPSRALPPMVASPSSYVEALPPGASTAPLVRPPTTEGQPHVPPRARRGLLVAIVAGAVVAIGGAVVAIATVSRTPGATTPATSPPRTVAVADAGPVRAADAAAVAVAVTDAGPDPDATTVAMTPPPAPPTSPHRPVPTPSSPAIAAHLAAARTAATANDRLAELAHAQAALKLDPGNVAATYLMGDALVATGDTDHGCQILGNIKRFPAAAERMRVAGCTN